MTGQTVQPMQVARAEVDEARAVDLLRTAESQGAIIPEGALAELFSTVTQAAGQNMLPGTRRETTGGAMCTFAVSLLIGLAADARARRGGGARQNGG